MNADCTVEELILKLEASAIEKLHPTEKVINQNRNPVNVIKMNNKVICGTSVGSYSNNDKNSTKSLYVNNNNNNQIKLEIPSVVHFKLKQKLLKNPITKYTVNKEISSIISHLLSLDTGTFDGTKILILEIDVNNKLENIRIHAGGSWTKDFSIQKFKEQVWNHENKSIEIHMGFKDMQLYEVCKIDSITLLELEDDPYSDKYDNYLSFVFHIFKRNLQDKYYSFKNFTKTTAEAHPSIEVTLIWKIHDEILDRITFNQHPKNENNEEDEVYNYF